MSKHLELVVVAAVEYCFLVLLWMAFVSKTELLELKVGLLVALIGTVADAVVKSEGMGAFRPQVRWLMLLFLEPWYVLKGLGAVVECLPHVLKPRSKGRFKAVQFDAGEQDALSATRRTLATLLLTMPPNSVVVGIDARSGKMLLHEIKPEPASLLARELGVRE